MNTAFDFTSAVLDPRITFSRALATATRVNSAGLIEVVAADTPRFDYDPITLNCRGLLVEESRSNAFSFTEDFNSWVKPQITVSTNVASPLAPNGTQTADKIIPNNVSTDHIINQARTLTAITYTNSVFVHAGEYNWFCLYGVSFANANAFFNVATGTVGSVTGTGSPVARITPAGGGWYRCELSFTASASNVAYGYASASANGVTFLTGDGVKGVYTWGAQLEPGAFATSYIPRPDATAVTRNADVATITGANFSDWWQASKGGVLVRARPGTVSGVRPWLQFDDGTANEIIALRGNTTNPELYIVDGGVAQAQIDAGTIAANTDYTLTGWWANNDCKARLDSGAVVTDTSATIPTLTQARLGSDGTNYLNGHLANISYYDSFSEQIYTRRKNKAVFNLM